MPSTPLPGVPGLMLFSRGLQVSTTTPGATTTGGAPGAAPGAAPAPGPDFGAALQELKRVTEEANAAAKQAMDAAKSAAQASMQSRGAVQNVVDYTTVAKTSYEAAKTLQVSTDQTLRIATKLTPPFIYMQAQQQ